MATPDQKRAMYQDIEEELLKGRSLSTKELLVMASRHNIPVSVDAITKSIKTGALQHSLGKPLSVSFYKKRIMISLLDIPPDETDFSFSKSVIDASCARPKNKSS